MLSSEKGKTQTEGHRTMEMEMEVTQKGLSHGMPGGVPGAPRSWEEARISNLKLPRLLQSVSL